MSVKKSGAKVNVATRWLKLTGRAGRYICKMNAKQLEKSM